MYLFIPENKHSIPKREYDFAFSVLIALHFSASKKDVSYLILFVQIIKNPNWLVTENE